LDETKEININESKCEQSLRIKTNMTLTPEQIKALKKQLLSQIQNLPEAQKKEAQAQIESLSPEALELMLKQQEEKQEPVFRLIIKGEIPSIKIGENEEALAVLEINPISKGHTIIISKSPAKSSKDIPEEAFKLAKRISKDITDKLKANSTEIQTESKFGETIINIIPIYNKPLTPDSPRKRVKKEELEEIANRLKEEHHEKKVEIIKIKTKEPENPILKMKRKIP